MIMQTGDLMNEKLRVLIIDDELTIARLIKRLLEKLGCEVDSVADGHAVSKALLAFDPEVIFLDLVMPEIDGVQIIDLLAEAKSDAKLILMSGLAQRTVSSVAEGAKRLNIDVLAAITKPFQPGQVEGLIEQVITTRNESTDNRSTIEPDHVTLPGPQLIYSAEQPLEKTSSADLNWYRIRLVWKLDDDRIMDFSDVLETSLKLVTSKGLLGFYFKMLALSQSGLTARKNQSGIKIPLPPAILLDPSAPNYLEECVSQAGLSKHAVSFEIDETDITGESEALLYNLSRLKIKGFKIGIRIRTDTDPLLSVLNKVPVDELILDMSTEGLQGPALKNIETEFQVACLTYYGTKANLISTAINITTPEQLAFAKHCNFYRVSGPIVS